MDTDADANRDAAPISINIVDQTPDAEDLINGPDANDDAATENIENVEEEKKMDIPEPRPVERPFPPKEDTTITIDPEHAYEESNEDYFRTTREKLASMRRERNELIVQMDKKEDELTGIERENTQYANRGIFEKINHERADQLHREIHDLRNAIMSKNRTVETLSGVIRTL